MSAADTPSRNRDAAPADVASVLEELREQVRSRRARLQLRDPDNPQARSLAELRRSTQSVNEVWFVSAHLPINWRLRIIGRLTSYAKRAVRIMLRWYINPIVEQQNRFNSAVARAVTDLVTHEERMAREWLLLEERINRLERALGGAAALEQGTPLESQEWENGA